MRGAATIPNTAWREAGLGPDGVDPVTTPTGVLAPEGAGASLELRPDAVEAPAAATDSLARSRPAVVEPLAPARYKVQFTASAELHDKLRRLTALMRARVPDGDLAAIIEQAVTEKLERLEAKALRAIEGSTEGSRGCRDGAGHAPRPGGRSPRRLPARRPALPLRRRAWSALLGGASARAPHRHPFGMGGDHSPANLSLLCPKPYTATWPNGTTARPRSAHGRKLLRV